MPLPPKKRIKVKAKPETQTRETATQPVISWRHQRVLAGNGFHIEVAACVFAFALSCMARREVPTLCRRTTLSALGPLLEEDGGGDEDVAVAAAVCEDGNGGAGAADAERNGPKGRSGGRKFPALRAGPGCTIDLTTLQ
eukprot:6982622-Alexandrium_andersonii.AAC.1